MEKVDNLVKSLDEKNMGSSVKRNCKCKTTNRTKQSTKKLLKKKNKNDIKDFTMNQPNQQQQLENSCSECHIQNVCDVDHSKTYKNNPNYTNSKENIEKSSLLSDPNSINHYTLNLNINRDTKVNDPERTSSNVENVNESSCFPKLSCCKISSRKYRKYDPKDETYYDNYKRLNQISPSVSTSCTATNSILTASSCLTSLLSENSLSNFSQDLSISFSNDSGFDETPCLLRVLYEDHKCNSNNENCFKKNNYFLNIHLRCLMNYMPKSFSDSDVIPHELKNCAGVQRDPVLSRRRNAICETSNEMRLKFYEALSAFLTLKAMAKYDFI